MTATTEENLPSPDKSIDVSGQVCPAPLVETRKELNALPRGGILEVIGDHPASIFEIPQALAATGDIVLQAVPPRGSANRQWRILVRRNGRLQHVPIDGGAHALLGGVRQ